MDERVIQFRVGVVIIAAALVTGILIFLFGEGVRSQYTIYMKFDTAPGVTVDTPIRKNGILIGRVSDVELLDDGVMLTAKIDKERTLSKGEVPRIGTATLLGDAVVDFLPGGEGASRQTVQEGETLANGVVQGNPLEAISMFVDMSDDVRSAVLSIDEAGRGVSELSKNVNSIFDDNDDQIKSIMDKSETAIEKFSKTMDNINEVVGDPELKEQLKQSLEGLPEIFADAKQTLKETRETLAGFEQVSIRAQRNLENLEGFTEPLGERGEKLVGSIERSIDNVDELLSQLVTFSEALNQQKGTLGKLVYDPEVYNRLNNAAGQIEGISYKLPRIVNDIGILTDKLARDPRLLGAKGALDRRPSGTGLKNPTGAGFNSSLIGTEYGSH